MLTPAPFPLPQPSQKSAMDNRLAPDSRRQKFFRTKWCILLAPLVLIIITLSTQLTAHPAFFDALAGISDDILLDMKKSNWGLHKRHPNPQAISFSSVASLPSTLSTSFLAMSSTASSFSTSPSNVPSIPSNPVLPPFPQPFDTSFSSNFSTTSCLNFFTNMTISAPFRQCRPFGLLEHSSFAFSAQSNITLLNNVVWGTCNTDVPFSQCTANMNWFAQSLRSNCAVELASNNVLVSDALNGLLIYSLMRNVGCQSNPSTNVYCFISATVNANPSDVYFYELPFGIPLPNTTTPSCSSCTKTIMGLYLAAVSGQDPGTTDPYVKSILAKTYTPAAQLSDNVCGTGYVQMSTSNGAPMSTFNLWFMFSATFVSSLFL